MTVSKALAILGLPEIYTEEELKKTYRLLIIRTHPDSVSEHNYKYDAGDINAAYEYLLSHKSVSKNKSKIHKEKRASWNSQVNDGAYCEREIYHTIEDSEGNVIGRTVIAKGKYTWCLDEDFSMFLLSIYDCSKRIISENDEYTGRNRSSNIKLHGEIAYLLAQQYVDTTMILSLLKDNGKDEKGLHIYEVKGMLERTTKDVKLHSGEMIFPAGVRNHKLYVRNEEGVIGYVSFKDDRLYYGIIPLFERKLVLVRMYLNEVNGKKRGSSSYFDIDITMKLLNEDKNHMIESINLKIEELLI